MLGRFAKVAPEYAREMTKALRMYLRFLASNGACRAELFNAVSSVPQSRLATLPRYIPTDDIERKIASCDLTRAAGLRDRAILLLLARLALRAGDICELRLDTKHSSSNAQLRQSATRARKNQPWCMRRTAHGLARRTAHDVMPGVVVEAP